MTKIFEVKDKSGRTIYLTDERWKHLNQEHPEVAPYFEEIKAALKNPIKITKYEFDQDVRYYYKYFKERAEHLLIILNFSVFYIAYANSLPKSSRYFLSTYLAR